jgi:hypothetical protein
LDVKLKETGVNEKLEGTFEMRLVGAVANVG